MKFGVRLDVYKVPEKSEHDPNILHAICSEGFVFNAAAKAATLNDPATGEAWVQVFRQPLKADAHYRII